jgi:hypothetical protein
VRKERKEGGTVALTDNNSLSGCFQPSCLLQSQTEGERERERESITEYRQYIFSLDAYACRREISSKAKHFTLIKWDGTERVLLC